MAGKKGVYEVEWLDITGTSAWRPREDAIKGEPMRCFTRGEIIEETPKKLVLAATVSGDVVADVTVIPKSCVVRRRRLH